MRKGLQKLTDHVQDGELWCKDARQLLFNDVASDAEAVAHLSKMRCQPAEAWNDTVDFAGWKEVPSSYLICEVGLRKADPFWVRMLADPP